MLSALQRALALALHDERPVERLRALADDRELALREDERALLRAVDADGFRLASLVVRKLRHERVLRGDPSVAAEHEAHPAEIARELREYCRAVAPAHEWPAQEARAFSDHRRLARD